MAEQTFSRRAVLASGGAFAAASAASGAFAGAPLGEVVRPLAHRVRLGGFDVATVLDGAVQIDGPHPIFGGDQTADAVAALMRENALPESRFEIGFTPVFVNTGAELIAFDAGNGAGARPARGWLTERMGLLGYSPEQVDVVVVTHFHPDHIAGLTSDGAPTFPNARYVLGAAEHNFWTANKDMRGEEFSALLDRSVFAIEDQASFIEPEQDVAPGVTAMAAFGHTPGHMVYRIESEGRSLVICADAANHFVASLQKPDWEVRFDMDKAAAAATRKSLFGMLASERMAFTGYHMPFPSLGYVEPRGDGFRYTAASYQLYL